MTIEAIKRVLGRYRQQEAAYELLEAWGRGESRARVWARRIAVVKAWLGVLTDEEWFVVTKHLVDRLSWPPVAVEYEKRWGAQQIRHLSARARPFGRGVVFRGRITHAIVFSGPVVGLYRGYSN